MKQTDFEETLQLADDILEYYFKNPEEADAPSPSHESHFSFFDSDGCQCVDNVSAFLIPEFEIEETVKSTTFFVDGTYDGDAFLHQKIERIIDHEIENTSIVEQKEVSENDA
ncbi:MAG: hypothetical protein IKW76_09375 [Clostridia bacterium]|nr:hypothetical protein [Clostridia bacterium]